MLWCWPLILVFSLVLVSFFEEVFLEENKADYIDSLSTVSTVKKALASNPESLELLAHLARLYLQQDDYGQSIGTYQRVIALTSINLWLVEAYTGLGFACLQQEQYDQSLQAYQEASQLAPELPEPYIGQGLVHERLDRLTDAVTRLKKALDLNPDIPDAWYHLSLIYEKQGDVEAALEHSQGNSKFAFTGRSTPTTGNTSR